MTWFPSKVGQHGDGICSCMCEGQNATDATQEVCSSLLVNKTKAPNQPTNQPTYEILLSVWAQLMLVIIYFDIVGVTKIKKLGRGVYTVKKVLDIFEV